MRATATRRSSAISSLSNLLDDDGVVRCMVDSWIQIQDVLSALPAFQRKKVALELEKLGQSLSPISGGYLWAEMGDYIKSRRKQLDISQIELAREVGFSSQFLGRIENGKVPLPDDALKKMITTLQMDEKKVARIYVEGALDYVRAVFTASKIR